MEKKKHLNKDFFYDEFLKLPPLLRTVPNLFKLLKEKENELPYKMVGLTTLYSYYHLFDWEVRIKKDTYATISDETKFRQVSESDYAHKKAWKLMYDLYNSLDGMKKHIDWKHTNPDDSKTEKLSRNQQVFNQTFKTMTGAPISLAEIYAMMEVLKATEDEETDNLELVDKLLDKKE